MASSTLPFDARSPRWALTLIAVAALVWASGAAYTLRMNPEVAFFRFGDRQKQGWLRQMRASHTHVTLVYGGSSVATSIDGRRLLERHGLPVVNLGLGAGMGAKVLSRYALEHVEPGDTLLIGLEPALLVGTIELEPLGVQFALGTGQPGLLREGGWIDWPSALLDLRPGGYHVITLAGKLALRKPLYRYALREFQDDGRQVVEPRLDLTGAEAGNLRLSADGRALLVFIRDTCASRGVRVAYSMSWHYCRQESAGALRRCHLRFLGDVSEILPVLKDPSLGVHVDPRHFADTTAHPTSEGAALRTDELAASLKTWGVWTPAELAAAGVALPNPAATP